MTRPSSRVSAHRLREWARSGAEATLKRLRAGDYRDRADVSGAGSAGTRRAVGRSVKTARRRARKMSAAARKAVSARIRRYLGGEEEDAEESLEGQSVLCLTPGRD